MKFDPSHYYSYNEIQDYLKFWKEEYPEIVTLGSIGTSYEGREIPLISLTMGSGKKPAVLLTGNIHSAELMSSCAVLYAIHGLLQGSKADKQIQTLLTDKIVYCIPRINVDAAERDLFTDEFYRGSTMPFHEEEDGVKRADVDGDGAVRYMRRPNPQGSFYASKLDNNVLFRIWPGMPVPEGATLYDMIPEGFYQGSSEPSFTEARCQCDIDPNRSFPFEWKKDSMGYTLRPSAGDYPLMDCETRALAQFVLAHPEIVMVVDTHTNMGAHLTPMEFCKHLESNQEDTQLMYALGDELTQDSGYQVRDIFPVEAVCPAPGSFTTWLYYDLGIPAWCSEIGSLKQLYTNREEQAKAKKTMMWMNELSSEEEVVKHHQQLVKWDKEHNQDRLFLEWHPYDHPQFGPIEIGGWSRSNETNPIWNLPEEYVENESRLQYQFYLGNMTAAANIKLQSFAVDGSNAAAVLANIGRFPSTKSFHAHEKGTCGTGVVRIFGISSKGKELLLSERLPVIKGNETVRLSWTLPQTGYDKYEIKIEGETAGVQSLSWQQKV
ncbi:MAG: M14 family zinc carboxypeptidase [Acutalibacter sp.]